MPGSFSFDQVLEKLQDAGNSGKHYSRPEVDL